MRIVNRKIRFLRIYFLQLIEKELQDTYIIIGLQERLKETNKRIKNLMSAIEQGIITPTTKERLEELEEERRDLEGADCPGGNEKTPLDEGVNHVLARIVQEG